MLGAIIGDIVGSRFEFDEIPQPDFEFFLDKPRCNYTDDTVLTIAVCDAVVNHRDYGVALHDWGNRYPNPKGGYGGMFLNWLKDPNRVPQNSWGNGAAMRISPIGWLFDDYLTVTNEAKKCTLVSHCHSEAVKGAQCVAALVFLLRTARIGKEQVENFVLRKFGYRLPPLKDINKIGAEGHFDSSCQETVPMAIRCFIESSSFEDAIRKAVMARGDTDTKADICGSLAEAFYGIPPAFAEKALEYLEPDMLQVIMDAVDKMKELVSQF
jgi:ADP-ribosylglycohydrolase